MDHFISNGENRKYLNTTACKHLGIRKRVRKHNTYIEEQTARKYLALMQLLNFYALRSDFSFTFFSVREKFMNCVCPLLYPIIYSERNEYKIIKAVAGFLYGTLLGIGK
jgi:hypothetical protein